MAFIFKQINLGNISMQVNLTLNKIGPVRTGPDKNLAYMSVLMKEYC